jgi:hypothetical protein
MLETAETRTEDTRLQEKEEKMTNKIHHFIYVLDASGSMEIHKYTLVKVLDSQIRSLAEDSKNHPGEETRVSIFQFSSPHRDHFECLFYDLDVLHVPSIAGLYKITGGTALCDAMVQVIEDEALIPEKYGEHFHSIWLLSDGEELHSTHEGRMKLPEMIRKIPGNYTLAGFVPNMSAKQYLIRYGFPPGNIDTWNTASEHGTTEVGYAMASATTSYMSHTRSGAGSSVQNLFEMNAPRVADLKKDLTPVTPGAYYFEDVHSNDLATVNRIDKFMEAKTRNPYVPEGAYYEFTKRERIQHYKKIAIAIWNKDTNTEDVYMGKGVRAKLGLPDDGKTEVRVSPGRWQGKGYKVYILTASNNRKLVPGTRVLVMR